MQNEAAIENISQGGCSIAIPNTKDQVVTDSLKAKEERMEETVLEKSAQFTDYRNPILLYYSNRKI